MTGVGYEEALWYLGRATGFVTVFLVTVVFVLGIAVRLGRRPPVVPAPAMTNVHRNASLLAVVFVALHVATVVTDPYVPLSCVDAVVPFVSAYRPFWLGVGTLAVDLALAIVVTGLLRTRMNRTVWRAVHLTAYALLPLILLHAWGNGTDAGHGLWFASTVAVAVAFGALTWWRWTTPGATPAPPRVGGTDAASRGRPPLRVTRR